MLIGDSGQFKRPGDWSPSDPWLGAYNCTPTTYNGSSPYQLFHLPTDPAERFDYVVSDPSFSTNATLQKVVTQLKDFFSSEVERAVYPFSRGKGGKPVNIGGPVPVWLPWLHLPPTPPTPAPPTPVPPPMPVPGKGIWVKLKGSFTDKDCPNVHKVATHPPRSAPCLCSQWFLFLPSFRATSKTYRWPLASRRV
jgi:hypothetical protein